jgi:CoA:oxalate CoA-transferase
MKRGPLDGIRVIEITMFQQGPVAGMRLGDLGAEVIKVEPPAGDPGRGFMKVIGAMAGLEGNNYYFEHGNRNKKSIVIDMKNPKGRDLFLRLIDKADVFLNNMSIKAPEKMGIGPEVLLSRNPRLIYAHASGWGRKGAEAEDLSFDYTGIARCGLMMAAGEPGDPPAAILPGIGDEIGGLMCAWGVTAALFAREKTGRGQVVDTSLMGSLIGSLAFVLAAPAIMGKEFPRQVRARAGNPLYNHYRCRDDRWLAIAHLDPDRYWPKICKAMGLEELKDDPRFCGIAARGKNAGDLVALLDRQFATKDREEWMRILKEEGCIFTPVQTPQEVTQDLQAWANNYFIEVQHPEWGTLNMPGFPWDFSETPASWRCPAPSLGEHTDEILAGLGFRPDEIASLKAEKIIV